MSTIQEISEAASKSPRGRRVDFKLEALVIPVSDVDRSKSFYSKLGWRLDADFAVGDSFRVVQFTPPHRAIAWAPGPRRDDVFFAG
jgi:catechol 2,3-dioxygenase-like lactoylglutathione lyase family enzyme